MHCNHSSTRVPQDIHPKILCHCCAVVLSQTCHVLIQIDCYCFVMNSVLLMEYFSATAATKAFRHCCGDPKLLLTLLSHTAPTSHVLTCTLQVLIYEDVHNQRSPRNTGRIVNSKDINGIMHYINWIGKGLVMSPTVLPDLDALSCRRMLCQNLVIIPLIIILLFTSIICV